MQSIWGSISEDSKSLLKNTSLECLVDANDLIKKASAALAASIFVEDIKKERSWYDLLDILAQNIAEETFEIKKAAVHTLGYICEYLK